MIDLRFSKVRAEKECDDFIYEGLSNIERYTIHHAKGSAYRRMKSKSKKSSEQLLEEIRAIKFERKLRVIHGKPMICFIQVDEI